MQRGTPTAREGHSDGTVAHAATPGSTPLARSGPRQAPDGLVHEAVARAKEGDTSALQFLYVRFADSVCADVRGIVRDPHAAEDVTRVVFASLAKAIQKYDGGDVSFAAWIIRTARDTARARDAAGAGEARRDAEARTREYPL